MHDAFIIVVEAIQRRALREPVRLMGFVRTVVGRQVAVAVSDLMSSRNCEREPGNIFQLADKRLSPELEFADRERMQLANRALGQLSPREREVLARFYFHYETPQYICAAMDLTETQFRLLKWRAKAKCGIVVRRYWRRKSVFVAHS